MGSLDQLAQQCRNPRTRAATLGLVDEAAQRLRLALDMFDVGEQMQRARLRREHPDASDEEIDAKVRAWLRRRPGAEHGDFPGPDSRRFG